MAGTHNYRCWRSLSSVSDCTFFFSLILGVVDLERNYLWALRAEFILGCWNCSWQDVGIVYYTTLGRQKHPWLEDGIVLLIIHFSNSRVSQIFILIWTAAACTENIVKLLNEFTRTHFNFELHKDKDHVWFCSWLYLEYVMDTFCWLNEYIHVYAVTLLYE